MLDFGPPLSSAHIAVAWKHAPHLGSDVFEGWRGDNREAQQEYVGLRVTEWSQSAAMSAAARRRRWRMVHGRRDSLVILLSGRIPQAQRYRHTVD